MRAILLLLMVTAGCGSKSGNQFELDIAVDAPAAASALVDGKQTLAAVGGVYSQGFPSVSAAANVHGTVATLDPDGTIRSTAPYELGGYCAAQTPLLRQTMNFVEGVDGSGAPLLALGTVECEKTDGSGVIVMP
jgi:hypothetical protein